MFPLTSMSQFLYESPIFIYYIVHVHYIYFSIQYNNDVVIVNVESLPHDGYALGKCLMIHTL